LELVKAEEEGNGSIHERKTNVNPKTEPQHRQTFPSTSISSRRMEEDTTVSSQETSRKGDIEVFESKKTTVSGSEHKNIPAPPSAESAKSSILLAMLKERGLSVDETSKKVKKPEDSKPRKKYEIPLNDTLGSPPKSGRKHLPPPSVIGDEISDNKGDTVVAESNSMEYENSDEVVQDSRKRASKAHCRTQRRSSVDVSCKVNNETPVALQFMTPQPIRGRMHRSASMSHVPTSDNNVVAMVLPSIPLDVESPNKEDIQHEYQEGEEGQAIAEKNEKLSDRVRGFLKKNLGRNKKRTDEGKDLPGTSPHSSAAVKSNENVSPHSVDKTSILDSNDQKHECISEEYNSDATSRDSSPVDYSPRSDGNTPSVNEADALVKPENSFRDNRGKKKKSRKQKSVDGSPTEPRESISWSRVAPRSPRRASMGRMVSKRIISSASNEAAEPSSNDVDVSESPKNGEVITWQRGGHRTTRRASMSQLQSTRSSLDGRDETGVQKHPTVSGENRPGNPSEQLVQTSSHQVSPIRRRRVVSGTIRRQEPTIENSSDSRLPEVPQTPGRIRMRRRLSTGALDTAPHNTDQALPVTPERPLLVRQLSVTIGSAPEQWKKDTIKRDTNDPTAFKSTSSTYDSDRIDQLINLEEEDSKDETPVEPKTPRKKFSKSFATVAQKFWKGKEGADSSSPKDTLQAPLSPVKRMTRMLKGDKQIDKGDDIERPKTPGTRGRRASIC
jgi:hypothetical protein